MNRYLLLLKALLLSTSQINIYKNCKDKKKRGKVIGNLIGLAVIYLMVMAYCILSCIGYGKLGMTDVIPVTCALLISMMAFILAFFKSNGYLFNFKEYDMLMSLPLTEKSIAACRFAFMYIKDLGWYLSISLAMLIGYGIYAHPAMYVYLIWMLLSLILPVIPMLAASAIGFVIARIGSGFKKKNLLQTILTFIFILLCFFSRFFIEKLIRDDRIEAVLGYLADFTRSSGQIYLPAGWFTSAVIQHSLISILLLTGISVVLFEMLFIIVGKQYRKINSALRAQSASRKFTMGPQKKRSVLNAIAYKEFKRMTGSTTYITNACVGELMCLIMGVFVLFADMDSLLYKMFYGAPLTKEMLYPAIPFIIYFLIGMVATTCCSPSLEGKNYWIVQSLPISKEDLYKGKMLFNIYLTVPFALFATICICISAKVPLLSTILYTMLELMLCAFSTAWGCVCGVKHMRLDWENEIEVIKQGSAIAIYMLPNMFITMGLIVGVVFLGLKMDHNVIALAAIVIVSLLTFLSYRRVMSLAKR